jgi:uncharacterized protein (DUF4415 family)
LDELPPLTEEQKNRLAALAAKPDSEIDFSDIPRLTERFWKNARPMREVMEERRAKHAEQVTLKLDRDVLQWLKKEDESQVDARANSLLRDAMELELLKKSA